MTSKKEWESNYGLITQDMKENIIMGKRMEKESWSLGMVPNMKVVSFNVLIFDR